MISRLDPESRKMLNERWSQESGRRYTGDALHVFQAALLEIGRLLHYHDRMKAERDDAVEVLKRCEWTSGEHGDCETCFGTRSSGHEPDCPLAAVLREADGGQSG